MKSFNIDADNNITAFANKKDAEAASGDAFRNQAELNKLASGWPASRLVEVWNSIPGFTPVKKVHQSQDYRGSNLDGHSKPGRRWRRTGGQRRAGQESGGEAG